VTQGRAKGRLGEVGGREGGERRRKNRGWGQVQREREQTEEALRVFPLAFFIYLRPVKPFSDRLHHIVMPLTSSSC